MVKRKPFDIILIRDMIKLYSFFKEIIKNHIFSDFL